MDNSSKAAAGPDKTPPVERKHEDNPQLRSDVSSKLPWVPPLKRQNALRGEALLRAVGILPPKDH